MNEDQFHRRIKEILLANRGPNNSPDQQVHDVLAHEVCSRSKKEWDEEVAAQVVREFEWMTGTLPKSNELPEEEIKALLQKFLALHEYAFIAIPQDKRRMPDNYIEGNKRKYICEIKSPELKLDRETQLYKFKTSHRKILNFIHTATKQFNSLDSAHNLPRVLVFTSSNFQLNWKSFADAIQGGVVDQQGGRMPDFSKTPVYTSTLPLLSGIDLYIWLQVSKTGDAFSQVSYFITDGSPHHTECLELVYNLSGSKLSSMDKVFSLTGIKG